MVVPTSRVGLAGLYGQKPNLSPESAMPDGITSAPNVAALESTVAENSLPTADLPVVNPQAESGFTFIRGGEKDDALHDWETGVEKARGALSEALNAKNVAFLLGAGCSSFVEDGIDECGIPTMAILAREFLALLSDVPPVEDENDEVSVLPTPSERKYLLTQFGIDIGSAEYRRNIERLMELLYSLRFAFSESKLAHAEAHLSTIDSLIGKAKRFLWDKCTRAEVKDSRSPVLALYQKFYRKLVLRDRSLPRPWVFTTNYDLFNETAMDRLGLPYANGFSGVIERRFNPATFRYALAEQLDLTNRKWTAVDGFVYLCKLHGSISWSEDNHGLFPIRESIPGDEPGKIMVYPTPAKQNSSLGSPYSDLFREFQGHIVREQSVLFTMGYAFGDEHINNIIYQALTIPTFRLVIFAKPDQTGEIAKLRSLGDPRIWIIGGKGPPGKSDAHYFETIIDHFMPELPNERISEAVEKVLRNLAHQQIVVPAETMEEER